MNTIKRRFLVVTMLTTVIIASGLYLNGRWAESRIEARLTDATTSNVAALWAKTMSFQLQEMATAQASLTRDAVGLNALKSGDFTTLHEQATTTFNRLSALNIITDFCISNADGKIVFSARNPLQRSALASTKKALQEKIIVRGVDWDNAGAPIAVLAIPLFLDQELIGVGTFHQRLDRVVDSFVKDIDVAAFIIDGNGNMVYATSPPLAQDITASLAAQSRLKDGVAIVKVNKKSFDVVLKTISDISGRHPFTLGVAKDDTEISRLDAIAEFRLNGLTVLVFVLSLTWLYKTIVREAERIRGLQDLRISQLTLANQEKEAINTQLQETHERLHREVTERIRAVEQQRHLSQLNKSILDAAGEGIFGVDKGGIIGFVNPRAASLLGQTTDGLIGKHVHEAVHLAICQPNSDHAQHECPIVLSIESGTTRQANDVFCNGGTSTYPASYICTPMKQNSKISGAVITFNDITERTRIEDHLRVEQQEQKQLIVKLQDAQNQLLQSEKMASIGQLAAGVAHEINNPVGYVSSNLLSLQNYIQDLCRVITRYEAHEMELPPEIRRQLDELKTEVDLSYLKGDITNLMSECQEGIERVKQIAQDLKDFSHVDEADWQWADLHKGLDSTLNVARNEIKYKATIVKEYGDIPKIECLPGQMNQVFMNLIVNAAQAIVDQGVITIKTGVESDTHIWVTIEDNGPGIKKEHLIKIFDPFFTTKPVGKGTGLGLSLSYSIVKKHQGRIDVESELGKGTCFKLLLPIEQSKTSTQERAL